MNIWYLVTKIGVDTAENGPSKVFVTGLPPSGSKNQLIARLGTIETVREDDSEVRFPWTTASSLYGGTSPLLELKSS